MLKYRVPDEAALAAAAAAAAADSREAVVLHEFRQEVSYFTGNYLLSFSPGTQVPNLHPFMHAINSTHKGEAVPSISIIELVLLVKYQTKQLDT